MFTIIKRYTKASLSLPTFLSLIFTPIILIFILGSAQSSMTDVEHYDIKVAVHEQGHLERLDAVFERYGIKVEHVNKSNLNQEEMKALDVDAFVTYDESKKSMIVTYGETSQIVSGILEQMLDSYALNINLSEAMNGEGSLKTANDNFIYSSVKWDTITPSAFEYYSVTMLAMIIIYSMSYGASNMSYELKEYRGERLRSSPLSSWKIYIGISISTVIVMTLQGLMVIVVTKYAYGVRWSDNLAMLLSIVGGFSFIGSNIGMIIGSIIPVPEKATIGVNILVPIMTTLSGGYFMLSSNETWLKVVQQLLPNYHIQEMLFSLNFSGDYSVLVQGSVYAAIATIVTVCILLISIRRATQ